MSYVNHLSCLLSVDKKAGFLKELWPPENVWDKEQMEASSSPSHASLWGLSVGRTLSRPTGHKVTMPTILSLTRDITANSASLGWRRIVQIVGPSPKASLLPLLHSGQISGGLQHQYSSVKGLQEWWSLGTGGGSRCHGLRWPEVARVQWDHGGCQRKWGMLGLGCWAPCSFWCSGCSLYRLAEGGSCTTPQAREASTWAPDITEAPGRSWNPARLPLTCTS